MTAIPVQLSVAIQDLTETQNAMIETLQIFINTLQNQQPRMDTTRRPLMSIDAFTSGITLPNVGSINNFSTGNTAGIPYYQPGLQVIYDKIVTS